VLITCSFLARWRLMTCGQPELGYVPRPVGMAATRDNGHVDDKLLNDDDDDLFLCYPSMLPEKYFLFKLYTWSRGKIRVRNEDIRKKTGSRKLENIIKESRLRWLGHVLRMDDSRSAHQATEWELRGYKRKPGRPRKNSVDVIKPDLKDIWMQGELRCKIR